ncbi:MAG TPA: serine/threonine-protein kinase [Gemmatimonadota bacterium]|nr:serine/threonine-protein kinase [Gemmatimonadota bacterium]
MQSNPEFIALQEALAGRYSIEGELGRGGMGIVYLAREVSLDRLVALKVLPPQLAAQPAARDRFLHEARIAARLSHPNIVPIHAVAEVGDFVFFAMAYIEGESLGARIRSQGPRPPSEVARILREVAWALAHAHAQGVIHRDIKPDNILLETSSGRALVADFGIASVVEAAKSHSSDTVSGTVEFMSPEQALGKPLGPACDTYSLGIVGFYALSGQLPFQGSTKAATLAQHISDPAPPVASVTRGAPSKLARAIDRCLAKRPEERFEDAQELAEVLGQSLGERREVPVALRVYIKRARRVGFAGGILAVPFLALAAGALAAARAPEGLSTLAGWGTFALALTVVPAGIAFAKMRRLLKLGFQHRDLVAALEADVVRHHEELAFELARKSPLYTRTVGITFAVSAAVVALWTVAEWIPGSLPLNTNSGSTFSAVALVALVTALLSGGMGLIELSHALQRRDVDGRLRAWFWNSAVGRWIFRVAGTGLKRRPATGSATYRPTEFAIGLEAERLFDELPRPIRRQLAGLPDVLRVLEEDAQQMRSRVEELNEVLARARVDRPSARALKEAPQPDTQAEVARRQEKVEQDILAARDATQQRLADAVAALETLRLGLLRMQAGSATVEGLTGDLAAAKDVAADADRLRQAQQDVQQLLIGKEE